MGYRASSAVALVAAFLASGCAPVDGDVGPTASADGGAGVSQSVEAVSVSSWGGLLLPRRGGTGGSPVTVQCRAGDVAVGIYGRQGNHYFEQLGLICAPLYANGTLGPHYTTNSAGPQGSIGYVECPAGYAFIGINSQSATYLDTITSINCRQPPRFLMYPATGSVVSRVFYPFGGRSHYDECPLGYVITSMIVRAGSWIDSEQPVCSYVVQ